MTVSPRHLPRRRTRLRGTAVFGVVAVLLAGAACGCRSGSADPRTGRPPVAELTVATWNMCGVRRWDCATTGTRTEKREAAARLATRDGARVILLQEVCSADVTAVLRRLGGSWTGAFRAYTWRDASGRAADVPCVAGGREAAGFAVLSAARLTGTRTVPSQQPVIGLHRGILCAVVAREDVTVCGAHLSRRGDDRAHPRWELRDDQLKALAGAARGARVVYGGDLNVDPPGRGAPAGVWPPGPYDRRRECDQASPDGRSGRPTHVDGHKLDYLFTGLPRVRCSVRDTGFSDHSALLLTVGTG